MPWGGGGKVYMGERRLREYPVKEIGFPVISGISWGGNSFPFIDAVKL